jgi:thiosulfate/3-mercaptopyruvate sulfurtransferase
LPELTTELFSMTTFTDLIGVAELQSLIDLSGCRVIDCRFNLMQPDRGLQEYLEGHIPGAVHAHLDNDLAGPVTPDSGRHPLPDPDTFVRTLRKWGIGNDTQVVAYDHANGAVAARLWWLLKWLGHEKAAVLDGGFGAWLSVGGAVSRAGPEIAPTSYEGEADFNLVATTQEIAAAVADGKPINLVDARDAARFNGEIEPIDSVAGHIPGSINMPFTAGVHQDGTWRDADYHRKAWQKILSGRPEAPLIAMCGSGVTACHLLLSARLAGRPLPRLYVGSWSEWIRDNARPVGRKI